MFRCYLNGAKRGGGFGPVLSLRIRNIVRIMFVSSRKNFPLKRNKASGHTLTYSFKVMEKTSYFVFPLRAVTHKRKPLKKTKVGFVTSRQCIVVTCKDKKGANIRNQIIKVDALKML